MLLPERVNITNEGCRVLNAAPLYFYVFKSPGWWGNLNLLGNVIGFLPFGFFLPVISRKLHNIFLVTAFGCVVSTCVEYTQYILRDGCCDVDDVILNTLGAFLGYIIFVCLNALRRKIYDE